VNPGPTTTLERFAFVLVRPKSAGNVGASARALKNMGYGDLRLVAPRRWNPRIAEQRAVHGVEVLTRSPTHQDLEDALADRTLVVGTTARGGPYRTEAIPIREAAAGLIEAADANRIALLFGPEDDGLSNEELKRCQRLVTIPTAPEYPSINLAQAVMIIAYELMLAAGAARVIDPPEELAPANEVEAALARMAEALIEIGFLPQSNPDHIMFALRAIFGRGGLRPRELDIVNGIARQIRWFATGGHETLAAKQRAGIKLR
jgi:TrmH family RNA methyltransferase